MKVLRVIPAVALVGALLAWPGAARPAGADTPCFGIGCVLGEKPIGGSLFCPSSKSEQVPAVRFSGDAPGLSANFDGSPADTGGQPATTIYQTRGIHAFSFSQYDEGCGGPALRPTEDLDTALGNWILGASIDLAAAANATHLYATHPAKWTAPIDKLEANATKALSDHIWTLLLPISLLCLGIIIIGRSRKGNVPAALKTGAWAILVLLIVTVAVQEPTRVGRAADGTETQAVSTIDSAMASEKAASPSAAGDLEVDNILMPTWLKGEFGSTSSPVAVKYGPQLLDATSMTWTQAADPDRAKVVAEKQKAFMDVASAIHDADPAAYQALKGQSQGRVGAALYGLGGVLVTVPFRIAADLLVMAALALLRLSVIFLPIIGVFALHDRFAPMLRKLGSVIFGALLTAVLFSAASALQVVATGFLLGPGSGIPNWVGLMLSAVLMVTMFFALRPVHRFMSLVPASTRQGIRSSIDTVETATNLALWRSVRRQSSDVDDPPVSAGRRPTVKARETEPGPVDIPVALAVEQDDRWGPVWEAEPAAAAANVNGHHSNGHATAVIEHDPKAQGAAAPGAYDWKESWPWTEDAETSDNPPVREAGRALEEPVAGPESVKDAHPEASGFNNEEVA